MSNALVNKLRLNTDSPFLKEKFDNPLKGSHLNWITIVSDAMQGSCGHGNISDNNGNVIGQYKAFGGMVMCTIHVQPGTTVIRMPSNPFNRAPVMFSDNQTQWGVKVDNIWTVTVTTTIELDGWCSYWS